ncbi:MAG: putative sugar kinase YdjH [Chlamydiia bacterium]|nr:putative sugar kinase YdjH [Chlamydiia bacterium]
MKKLLLRLSIFAILSITLPATAFSKEESSQTKENYDILGLGSAFIDYILKVNDEELEEMKYDKGTWAPIEYTSLRTILKEKDTKLINTTGGGSSANVIKGLAKLGQRCAVLGKIGADEQGSFYLKSLKNIEITPFLHQGSLPTGQALCFVTPDGQRTMRTYLGASHSNENIDINPKIFNNIKLFHLEGYQLQNPKLFKEAIELAKKQGAKITLDLSSIGIVKTYKDDLLNILPKYVDIVFANEAEAFELTHLYPQEACDFLATFCDVAVVTMGNRGSWAKSGTVKFYTPAIDVKCIDTTGAGDLFASGFLHGYLNNENLQKCAWIGTFVASKVVQQYGSEVDDKLWKEIYKGLDESASKEVAHNES